MEKVMFRGYRMMPKMLDFGPMNYSSVLTLPPPGWVAVIRTCVAFKEAYNAYILQFWHLLIDEQFVLFHVKFEDELYLSILQNRATHRKNSQLEIVKFLKKSNVILKSRLPFSNSHAPVQVWAFKIDWSIYKKVKSWRVFQVYFIEWMVKLYVGLAPWNTYSTVMSHGMKKGRAGQRCKKCQGQCAHK
jgi:hypothetical protein